MKHLLSILFGLSCLYGFSSPTRGNVGSRSMAFVGGENAPAVMMVEYLEAGEGTELIDTGTYYCSTNKVYAKVLACYGPNGNPNIRLHTETFYYATNGYYRLGFVRYGQSRDFFYASCMLYGMIPCRLYNYGLDDSVPLEIETWKEYENPPPYPGTEYAIVNGYTFPNGYSWDIPLWSDSTITLFTNVAKGNRIYYFKVENQLDLIPVRIGKVGYMYDRISGNFFGNVGSGYFACGPDISPLEQ